MCSTRLNAGVPSLASIHFGLAENSDRVCDTLANSVSMTHRVVKRARFAQCENEVSEEANLYPSYAGTKDLWCKAQGYTGKKKRETSSIMPTC